MAYVTINAPCATTTTTTSPPTYYAYLYAGWTYYPFPYEAVVYAGVYGGTPDPYYIYDSTYCDYYAAIPFTSGQEIYVDVRVSGSAIRFNIDSSTSFISCPSNVNNYCSILIGGYYSNFNIAVTPYLNAFFSEPDFC